ncbi:MAG: IPT/TIG domain-containing protein, partial [Prevotella sp.]|nr:IPT/TIG domain-containing protein [Prevotella sp.]
MKKIYNVFTLLVVALMGLSLAACSNDNLDTNQYKGEVSLNVYGPSPVMRGGTLRFLGSNLDQVREVIIPDGISITNIEVKQAGVPSEIRVTVPKDGPVPGKVVLVTNTDLIITTKTDLKYTESIVITSFPLAAMPGDVIKIEGDYLNLVQSLAFADNVLVSMEDFKSHSRYAIEVEVPEEAKTGKLALYTADLTVVDKNSVDYQIIETESAIEIGVPTIHKLKGRNEAEALGNITAKAGETITITGTYLQLTDDITIGGISADNLKITNDDTDITFTLPAEAPDGDILLVCKSGIEVPVGTLTTVKPTNCVATPNPVKAGQALQIDGKDMDLVTDVVFADSKGEYTIANNQNIINTKQAYAVTVPETATEGNLKLAMANGAQIDVPFTLVKPTVTGYNSTSVSAGGTVTINGTNLDLVKKVQFGESDVVNVEGTADAITLTVPMNATSGAPVLTLANGTTVANVPEITIQEAVFCYFTELPAEDAELKAGDAFALTVANGDKLTGVEINGEPCQFVLTNDNKLIIGIPAKAKKGSKVRLISSNGE